MSNTIPQKRSHEATRSDSDSDSESDSQGDVKRSNVSIDPDEGLSVANVEKSEDDSSIIEYDINGNEKKIELEVIDSSSSDSDSVSDSDSDNNNKGKNNVNSNENNNADDSDEYENSDDDSDIGSDISECQFEEIASPDEEIDLKLYDKDFILPPLKDIKITKKMCSQARNYLKSEGHISFLDLLLPSGPTPEDIIQLTRLLGFRPRRKTNFNSSNNALQLSIVFLRAAINRVLKTRTRLDNFHTLDNVRDALNKAQNILVLTGAGISTSLGIPDFRSSQGFYSKMKNLGLDDPQDVFSLEIFKENPLVFYSIAHMILPPEHSFTPLHGFIKLLQDKGKLLRNYTQNIDNLEANAGVFAEKLVQCHGSFATASCISCKYKIPGETLYPNLRSKQIAYCPFCQSERKTLLRKYEKMEDEGGFSAKFRYINSFGVMKPDITFFGENLPDRYHNTIKEDIRKCDLLICIGTSLKVAPVSEIVNRVPNEIPQILINRDPINHCEFDVELLGYCDQVISWVCGEKLKWKIDHKDFEQILHSGLELQVLDEDYGRYKITDANERVRNSLKKIEEDKIKEAIKKEKDGDI